MDNTELHYLTYDKDAIWEKMILAYLDAGGDILYPGDEKEILLRAVLSIVMQAFAGVDNALRMQTLRYAVGDYLDMLGEQRGCARIAASKATATVTIVTNATGEADVLPTGTAMTADGEIFYLLTEELILSGGVQTLTASVEADRAGSVGNALTAGTQLQPSATSLAINSIVAASDAAGGNEEEDDETYRDRIRSYGLTSVSAGPARQYEQVAMSVSSEIVDARALNLGAGQVGVYLILSSETGTAAILQAVEEALSADDVRPLTDSVTVAQATDVPYVLNVRYAIDSEQSTSSRAIAAAIDEAVTAYQDWQESRVGRAFNPDRLMAAIYQAGAMRVIWGEDSAFDGGTVAYTEIGATERCKGTITVEAME